MNDNAPAGIIAWLDAMLGGAATTLVAAITMRLIIHTQEVRKHRRPMFGVDLLLEPFVAVGMAILGDALGNWIGISHSATIGVIGVLSYMGPKGVQKIVDVWINAKVGGEK